MKKHLQNVENRLEQNIVEESTICENNLHSQGATNHEQSEENVVSNEHKISQTGVLASANTHDDIENCEGGKTTCENKIEKGCNSVTLVYHDVSFNLIIN